MGLFKDDHKDQPSQPTLVGADGSAQVSSELPLESDCADALRQAVGDQGGARSKMDEVKAREQQIKADEKAFVTTRSCHSCMLTTSCSNKHDKKEAKHEAKEERKEAEAELKAAKKEVRLVHCSFYNSC